MTRVALADLVGKTIRTIARDPLFEQQRDGTSKLIKTTVTIELAEGTLKLSAQDLCCGFLGWQDLDLPSANEISGSKVTAVTPPADDNKYVFIETDRGAIFVNFSGDLPLTEISE